MAQLQFRSDDNPKKWPLRYGNGGDGDKVVSSNETYNGARAGLVGQYTADPNTQNPVITIDDASSFANGDLVIIHQTRGGQYGKWQLNKIKSGGGSTSLTLSFPLLNDYNNDSPGSGPPFDTARHTQIVEMKQYKNVTIDAGFYLAAPSWDGNDGGILPFFVKDTLTVNGQLLLSSKGFRGGTRSDVSGNTGEGVNGFFQNAQPYYNGGGGGSKAQSGAGGGAGGGSASAGNNGSTVGSGVGGIGGIAVGNSELTEANFGGGGGMGGDGWQGGNNGDGGYGGAFGLIIAKNILVNNSTGSIISAGGVGENSESGHQKAAAGGGGGGGSLLLKGQTVNIGTNRISAPGGNGGIGSTTPNWGASGGNGSIGRIHIDYAKQLLGSAVTPSVSSRQDKSLFGLQSGAAVMVLRR